MTDRRREIPAVDRLLGSEPFRELLASHPRPLVLMALAGVLEDVRNAAATGDTLPEDLADSRWYAERTGVATRALQRPSLRPVINATGVVLHTNLGRAPLAGPALAAIERVARGYSNLEYDVEDGGRGSRYTHCAGLLRRLTGAEAALVVNNNAAALVLALNTLAVGRETVISRGELVEIGGSFRIPDIMARSGATMVEVGATNRTHLSDYRRALTPLTAAILKVHQSNFRVAGYTAEVEPDALAGLAREHNLPLVHDLGSGLLLPAEKLGLPLEPTPTDALAAGADVVTMSGDKLLGGPQAGIILGRADLVEAMRRNPLCRALRVDKLTLAALEATLTLYLDHDTALREIPTLRAITLPLSDIERRAQRFATRLEAAGAQVETIEASSAVGGGAFPETPLPTRLVCLRASRPAHVLERDLRAGDPAIIARIVDDRLAVDLRTVDPADEDLLFDRLRVAAAS